MGTCDAGPGNDSGMTKESILVAERLTRSYNSGDRSLTVLRDVNFRIEGGESVSIVGPSGSGKSTLLALCAGLDLPTSGETTLLGHRLSELDEDARADLRLTGVGFIFQSFRLIPTLTALENTMLPSELLGGSARQKAANAREKAMALLAAVELTDRVGHYPAELSGGEQQRVAIARAFMNDPRILFADEPTGNLDTKTGCLVIEHLFALNRDHGTTLILVTHDEALARRTDRILTLHGGELVSDARRADASRGSS